MSFQIRNIREISNDPISKFTNLLSKKLSRFLTKDQVDQLGDNEDIYEDGRDVETVIRIHDDLLSEQKFTLETQYFPPTEPDLLKLSLWLRGHNMGNSTIDWSGFNNNTDLHGDPLLVDGAPHDDGIHTYGVKSLALRFNAGAINTDYLYVNDSFRLDISGIAFGNSYFMRFKVFSLSTDDGFSRRLWEKTDSATPNDGIQVRITTDGRIVVIIKRGGVEYKNQTNTGVIIPDTVYDMWVTYAVIGNVTHVYVNNVDRTLSAFTDPVNWHDELTDEGLTIFKRGAGSDNGYVYGDLYDFRVYREKVVSATEVGYHYTNKWTIANIPYGQVMITNYWATYYDPGIGFTLAGYTTTGYTAG